MIKFKDLRNSDLIPGEIYEAGHTGGFFAGEVISNIFKFDNLRGIGNQGGIRRSMIENNPSLSNEEAFVILLDTKGDPDWPNKYNNSTKILKYYGDNKDPKKQYLDTKQRGNEAFEKYYRRAYSKTNENIAPFFYFERINGKDVRFIGIAVPFVEGTTIGEALNLDKFTKKGEGDYENYVARFTILETPVPRQWLYDLKIAQNKSEYFPTVWYNFLQSRELPSKNKNYVLIPDTTNHPENTGYRMTAYRKTQSKFRSRLLDRESGCQLCNLSIPSLLVASHIVPWAIADESQKVNLNNGLLLCISHDALFDKCFISFNEDGQILISDELPSSEFERLHINEQMIIDLLPEQEQFMRIHRAAIRT
ncbi:HNH endonuclease [Paenisporosarcina macmurdoensis]|uniref:HNH endonuclease n=1 Tax=Paenisporosarcina macmurdoensis TaxID=212659 RepID=A0ABW1LB43_9BACL